MSSSLSTNWTLDNNSIIIEAFSRIGISMISITQEQTASAIRSLNLELQSYSNKGPNLWLVQKGSQLLTPGTATYVLPSSVVYIFEAYIRTNDAQTTQNDRIVTALSVNDYAMIPNKNSQGLPTVYWFNRQITPEVTLWQVPDTSATYLFQYYYMKRVEDAYPTQGQTPNIPYRFLDAICAGVAARLGRKYAPALVADLKMESADALHWAQEEDIYRVPLYIRPDFSSFYEV